MGWEIEKGESILYIVRQQLRDWVEGCSHPLPLYSFCSQLFLSYSLLNTVQILLAIMDGLIFSKERNHGRRSIICLNEKQVALKDKELCQMEQISRYKNFLRDLCL